MKFREMTIQEAKQEIIDFKKYCSKEGIGDPLPKHLETLNLNLKYQMDRIAKNKTK